MTPQETPNFPSSTAAASKRPVWHGASAALLTLLVVNAVWAAEPAWANQHRPAERIDHRSIGRALATAVRDLVGEQLDAAPTSRALVSAVSADERALLVGEDAPVVAPPREALIDLPPPTC